MTSDLSATVDIFSNCWSTTAEKSRKLNFDAVLLGGHGAWTAGETEHPSATDARAGTVFVAHPVSDMQSTTRPMALLRMVILFTLVSSAHI
ncbi:hypothetical protein [Microbacterium gorillae]|uniref:hypothetical protein n=1 Tax=Microbacterium gorillae TaxID=1231063 RepID=UPI003D976B30